jgi:hypothetical protein
MTTAQLGMQIPEVAHDIDTALRAGKPEVGWRGDQRLYLHIGVVTAQRSGVDPKTGKYKRKGDVVAWQWQVRRNCESGKDEVILQLKGHELYTIFDRLIKMDPRTPGFEPVMDTVEREDAQVQKEKGKAIQEAVGQHAEHLWALVGDKQNGRTTFRGLPGRNPDRQM